MHHKNNLIERLDNKRAVVGVVGLGYVGLPLILRYNEVGYSTVGLDIDPQKIEALGKGETYIEHINATPIHDAIVSKQCLISDDFSLAKKLDAIILCVPTPLTRYREPDLTFVLESLEAIAPHLREGQVLSLESTTYPGTTEEELRPRLEELGFRIGENMFLVYSPEREDPGNANYNTRSIPKVCGGSTSDCLAVGEALYGHVIDKVVSVSSTQAAEMTKILENTYRAVNIALVNELKLVADKMDIDIFEVIRAADTKPFGYKAFYPGPGLGGHCIPIDPFYLTWKAREYDIATKFIELAGEINTSMPDYVIRRTGEALNRVGKSIKNSKILLLGAAYKKNVDDLRESPSLVLIEKLIEKGARVEYSDPHVPTLPPTRKHKIDLSSVELSADSLASFDCVVIATDHDVFDWDLIRLNASNIVDTRGVYDYHLDNVTRA